MKIDITWLTLLEFIKGLFLTISLAPFNNSRDNKQNLSCS